MQILQLNFLLYATCGIWRPVGWSSTGYTLLYGMYTVLAIYLIIFTLLGQFLDLVFIVDNIDDFTYNFLSFTSMISVLCKMITPLTRRGRIIDLIEILQQSPCKVCNQEEMDIQAKFDRSIRSVSLSYLLLSTCSVIAAVRGLVLIALKGQLPLRAWVPYVYSSPLIFWLTCVHHMLGVALLGTMINVSTETLVYGLCLQTCAQLEILTHRIQKVVSSSEKMASRNSPSKDMSNRANRLSEHICHHLHIIRYAKLVNEIYGQVMFTQFFVSILVLCSILYYLSSHITFEDVTIMFTFMICMFLQMFFYCWAGNEVILKSTSLSDAIYEMNWILMTISEQKDLLIIMKRSTRPIKFTSSFLVTLSLSSYCNLLKTTYSAFNVLQQS